MAFRYCCGFECGVFDPNLSSHVGGQGGSVSFNTDTAFVRNGLRSLRANPANDVANISNGLGVLVNINVVRVAVYFASLPTGDASLVVTANVDRPGAYFKASDSKIYAGINPVTPTFGTTGVSVTTGRWYILDVRINASANPWLVDVRVDGVNCSQLSVSAAAAASGCQVGIVITNNTADIYFDDWVVCDASDDYPIGDGYVHPFVPTADGAHNIAGANDFERTLTGTDILNATTDAYLLVDDLPLLATMTEWINMLAPPSAANYVECIFGPPSGIPTPVIPPRAVEIIVGQNQSGTGTGNIEMRLNDNGTTGVIYTVTGGAGVTVATGQRFRRAHFADPPSAASAWVIGGGGNGDFTDLRIQFGSPAALDVNPDQYFGCALIEAEFPGYQFRFTDDVNS